MPTICPSLRTDRSKRTSATAEIRGKIGFTITASSSTASTPSTRERSTSLKDCSWSAAPTRTHPKTVMLAVENTGEKLTHN
jgi:hypothetical protein